MTHKLRLTALTLALFMPIHALAQDCETTVECAQEALEAVSVAMSAVEQLRAENAALRAELEAQIQALRSVPARSTLQYTATRGSGSNAMAMNSYCPEGQVMVGIEMVIGGTCRNQCEADGGAFHKYRIVCSPRFQ